MDISKRASVVAKVADFGTCQQMAGIVAGRKVENPGARPSPSERARCSA